eukprot:356183-Chlamydomonas_euryale.AAC.6
MCEVQGARAHLDHEVLDDAVEGGPLVAIALLAGRERDKVCSRLGHLVAEEAQHDAAGRLATDSHVKEDLLSNCRLGGKRAAGWWAGPLAGSSMGRWAGPLVARAVGSLVRLCAEPCSGMNSSARHCPIISLLACMFACMHAHMGIPRYHGLARDCAYALMFACMP